MARLAAAIALTVGLAGSLPAAGLVPGKPDIRSLSALAFGPGGVLFVGDGKGGAVFAIDLGPRETVALKDPKPVPDVEGRIAALLGAAPADVMIHDLAVDPLSKQAYLAVSRGRSAWNMQWLLPNDVADASVLVRLDGEGKPALVDLSSVPFARAALPNPVDPAKKVPWKDASLRADTITDMAYADGTLWVAGLSNEEFASTMWRVPYPFGGPVAATTLENYHGAHGKFETEAPVRTFVFYPLKGKTHVLAAYLCTPLVTFAVDDIKARTHLRGKTVGEFGSGNYPLDMVLFKGKSGDRLLIANSNLPFMIVDPKDVEAFPGAIETPVTTYVAGVKHATRSGTGVLQLDNMGEEHVAVLRRLGGGQLDLVPVPMGRY
ncbi:MAG TPA: hypothetical protein VII13_16275 [Vicinamibacteria bacterium]|jgi:hypothetical protein